MFSAAGHFAPAADGCPSPGVPAKPCTRPRLKRITERELERARPVQLVNGRQRTERRIGHQITGLIRARTVSARHAIGRILISLHRLVLRIEIGMIEKIKYLSLDADSLVLGDLKAPRQSQINLFNPRTIVRVVSHKGRVAETG